MNGPGRGNLPAERSGFVGRGREVSEVRRLLKGHRLVTLTGVGGVGKTRLGLHVAHGMRRGFRGGVWLVELATVSDGELMTSAVADVLGVADRSDRSVLSTLTAYLEDKQLLLVLDNCEHLVGACAVLTDKLLATAPGLHVLVTSREPLQAAGEQVLQVFPLALPDPPGPVPGDLVESEATQLFAERARAVLPSFEVTESNRVAIAAVCRRVEGIPLAIELAAARTRVLSPQQILARLDDRFGVLTRGPRDAPARHRTLAATLDWSYELCSPAEQLLWSRVTVFAGGFDLEAVERVCAGDGIGPGEVFELVTGLVDKSILIRDSRVAATVRYGLLETVREYGLRRLSASGAKQVMRHREYYLDLARQAEAERVSPQEVHWLLRLRREWPNLRAAMESGLAEQSTAPAALAIAVTLRDLWYGTGRHREALSWLTRALTVDQRPTRERAIALSDAGYLTLRLGDQHGGERLVAQAQALADQLGDPQARLAAVHARSAVAMNRQPPDFGLALSLSEQALAGASANGDLRRVGNALLQLSVISTLTGDPARGVDYAEQCVALGQERGAEWTTAWGLVTLARARWCQGEHEQIDSLVYEALRTHRRVRDSYATGVCLEILVWMATAAGHHEHAARLLGACQAIQRLNPAATAAHGPFANQYQQCRYEVRQALGEVTYTAAFEDGAHLTLDEAIGYALGEDRKTHRSSSPRAARPEPGPLTPRELQIADLVAQGLTNKQIAARLVVSQRTAEGHVQNILTTLGFTSRAQIASWIIQRNQSEAADD